MPISNIPSSSPNYFMDVPRQRVRGMTTATVMGRLLSLNKSAVPADIWPLGGLYPFPTSNVSMEIVSSSLADSALGDGARTVRIVGLDQQYYEIINSLVVLNGTTPVVLPSPHFRINDVTVVSVGTIGINVGNISIRATGGGETYAYVEAGCGRAHQAIYTIPINYNGYISSISAQQHRGSDGPRYSEVVGQARAGINKSWVQRRFMTLTDNTPYQHITNDVALALTEGTDIRITALEVEKDGAYLSSFVRLILAEKNAP